MQLPCKHVLDGETIISSLSANRPSDDVGPMCKARLFVPPQLELLKMPSAERHQLIIKAVRRAAYF